MNIIDMHCDTLMEIAMANGPKTDMRNCPNVSIDFSRMQRGGTLAQFFAIFVMPKYGYQEWYSVDPLEDEAYVRRCIDLFQYNMNLHSNMIAQAFCSEDIIRNQKDGKMSGILTIEDGGYVNGSIEKIKKCYDQGIRVFGLIWNHENCFGTPNSPDPALMNRGLTDFGKEAVDYMQQLGMVVDVSHLNDGGFYDIAARCKKPFIATHSNCRAVSPHPRNLTDEMIRILADKGGVMGLNFCAEFLDKDITNQDSTIDRMVTMMKHMYRVGGRDVMAIGTDFDGIWSNLEIRDCSQMPLLLEALKKAGFSDDDLDYITHKNVLRALKDAM